MGKKAGFLAASLTVFAVFAVSLQSCDIDQILVDIFGEPYDDRYFDTDRNWLEGFAFDAFQGTALSTDPLAGGVAALDNGAWDWAWRGWTGTTGFGTQPGSPGGEYPYMTLTAAGTAQDAVTAWNLAEADAETLPAGLPAAEPVFRLALANLFIDGDLEGSAVLADSGWAEGYTGLAGSRPTAWLSFINPSASIHGRSLLINGLLGTSLSVVLDFDTGGTLVRIADGLPDVPYYLSFVYSATAIMNPAVEYGGVMGNASSIRLPTADPGFFSFSTPSLIPAASLVLSSETNQIDLTMDDFGAVRSDLSRELVLRLAATDADLPGKSGLPLVPGLYRFSVWVHADVLSSDIEADTDAAEPYRARMLTMKMSPLKAPDGAATDGVTAPGTFSSSIWSSGWTRVSVQFDSSALTFPDKSPMGVIELRLEIGSDGTSAYPGTLLLARPELNLFLDGY